MSLKNDVTRNSILAPVWVYRSWSRADQTISTLDLDFSHDVTWNSCQHLLTYKPVVCSLFLRSCRMSVDTISMLSRRSTFIVAFEANCMDYLLELHKSFVNHFRRWCPAQLWWYYRMFWLRYNFWSTSLKNHRIYQPVLTSMLADGNVFPLVIWCHLHTFHFWTGQELFQAVEPVIPARLFDIVECFKYRW